MQSLAWSIIQRASKLPVRSAPPRLWLPALARRDALGDRLFREKQSKLGSPGPGRCFCSAIADKAEKKKPAAEESNHMVETTMATQDLHCHYYMPILSGSSHRDGAIYKNRLDWESDYDVDIADRAETLLEPSYVDDMTCDMLQIFSLKLAKPPATASNGSIELYGFMAARDEYDLKLNYVFNRGREDPVVVQEGSLIQMTGPKRGMAFHCNVLLEFDMRIKNGEREEDDAQLIDGMSEVRGMLMPWEPTPVRLDGDCGGAVEVSSALVSNAVAAIVEVIVVSEVRSGFHLSLSSTISAMEAHEFQLFHGSVGDWGGERRFAIAVTVDTMMHLKFVAGHNGSGGNVERRCSFRAKKNGQASRKIKLELVSIWVKVTWAAWPDHMFC